MSLLLLLACSAFDADNEDEDEDLPVDYLLLGVSGHCFGVCDYDVNGEYLAQQGTLDVLADALPDADGEVDIGGAGDEYYSWEDTDSGELLVAGFLDMVAALEWARDEWFDKRHRVAVACHSHGCVWAHTALFVVDDLVVDWLVDLDAESACWEEDVGCGFFGDDWHDVIDEDGADWPFDIGDAADSWDIPGVRTWQDVEDVVPSNVLRNLEVASDDATFIQDAEPNHYPDGSTFGIDRFQSRENHENSDEPDADGVLWAAEQIAESG